MEEKNKSRFFFIALPIGTRRIGTPFQGRNCLLIPRLRSARSIEPHRYLTATTIGDMNITATDSNDTTIGTTIINPIDANGVCKRCRRNRKQ